MVRKTVVRLLILALAVVFQLMAHEASKHKGKPVEGEIVSASADKLELKTAQGVTVVTLSEKTKIEHGNQAVTAEHLKKGQRIKVFGTKLPSGELAAREILLGGSGQHGGHAKGTDHGKH